MIPKSGELSEAGAIFSFNDGGDLDLCLCKAVVSILGVPIPGGFDEAVMVTGWLADEDVGEI